MIKEGQVVLFRFPQADQTERKLRPALVIRKLPGRHEDWLICMISSRLLQKLPEFDEVVSDQDDDFQSSGLKQTSLVRIARLAVVQSSILLGAIGEINADRLERIRKKLADWLINE